MHRLFTRYLASPLGSLAISGTATGVSQVVFCETQKRGADYLPETPEISPPVHACLHQLQAYFAGELQEFDVAIAAQGTVFQQRVWTQLQQVPYGATQSYLQLARALGDEKCIRAAANANGRNPLSILIPCHRIIGSDGSLVGYAGDLWRKKWLLAHEYKHSGKQSLTLFDAAQA